MFENLKNTLQRIDAECGEVTHEVLNTVDRELVQVQDEAMSFLDGLKAQAVQHREPISPSCAESSPSRVYSGEFCMPRKKSWPP